MYCHPHRSAAN